MEYFIGLLPGLGRTFGLWIAIVVIGFPLGLVFGYATAIGTRPARRSVLVVVDIARGFPGLVTLYLVYSGLPAVGILLSNTAAVVIAFAFTTAGYTAGIFRAAIQAVPESQMEAAAVIGIGFWKAQRLVILPQALHTVLPALMGFSVIVLQATSLGYAVGLQELTGLAYNLGAITFRALRYMIASGILYLIICVIIGQVAALLQRRRGSTKARNALRSMTEAGTYGG